MPHVRLLLPTLPQPVRPLYRSTQAGSHQASVNPHVWNCAGGAGGAARAATAKSRVDVAPDLLYDDKDFVYGGWYKDVATNARAMEFLDMSRTTNSLGVDGNVPYELPEGIQLQHVIGAGMYGTVFKAAQDGKTVVVKCYQDDGLAHQVALQEVSSYQIWEKNISQRKLPLALGRAPVRLHSGIVGGVRVNYVVHRYFGHNMKTLARLRKIVVGTNPPLGDTSLMVRQVALAVRLQHMERVYHGPISLEKICAVPGGNDDKGVIALLGGRAVRWGQKHPGTGGGSAEFMPLAAHTGGIASAVDNIQGIILFAWSVLVTPLPFHDVARTVVVDDRSDASSKDREELVRQKTVFFNSFSEPASRNGMMPLGTRAVIKQFFDKGAELLKRPNNDYYHDDIADWGDMLAPLCLADTFSWGSRALPRGGSAQGSAVPPQESGGAGPGPAASDFTVAAPAAAASGAAAAAEPPAFCHNDSSDNEPISAARDRRAAAVASAAVLASAAAAAAASVSEPGACHAACAFLLLVHSARAATPAQSTAPSPVSG